VAWPSVNFAVNPGEGNLAVLNMIPAGPEKTIEHLDFYLPTKEPSEQQRAAIDWWVKVFRPEDIALVESVQRGLRSRGYSQGRYVVNDEHPEFNEVGVHQFHRLVLKALNG